MAFKRYWMEFLRAQEADPGKDPKSLMREFDQAVERVALTSINEALSRTNLSPDDVQRIKDAVTPIIPDRTTGLMRTIGQVKTNYIKLYEVNRKLQNTRRQELLSDIYESLRGLFFLILRAVSIAAVILLTGYLAHEWGSPLPLLRLV